jgi:hypothetical protein
MAVAAAAARDEISDYRANPKGDGHGLIRMLMHRLVGDLRAFHRLFAHATAHFFGSLQRGGQAPAGFPDFFPGHIGGGRHQGAGIIGQLVHVTAPTLVWIVHKFGSFPWLLFTEASFFVFSESWALFTFDFRIIIHLVIRYTEVRPKQRDVVAKRDFFSFGEKRVLDLTKKNSPLKKAK